MMDITQGSADLKSYFDENMKLLDDENLEALFTGGPGLHKDP